MSSKLHLLNNFTSVAYVVAMAARVDFFNLPNFRNIPTRKRAKPRRPAMAFCHEKRCLTSIISTQLNSDREGLLPSTLPSLSTARHSDQHSELLESPVASRAARARRQAREPGSADSESDLDRRGGRAWSESRWQGGPGLHRCTPLSRWANPMPAGRRPSRPAAASAGPFNLFRLASHRAAAAAAAARRARTRIRVAGLLSLSGPPEPQARAGCGPPLAAGAAA